MDASPLLRLPAEIREYIYTLVLGGNDIHVANKDSTMAYSICREAMSHREITRQTKGESMEEYDFPAWYDHVECATHASKHSPTPLRLDLRLLLMCRQIYQEAEALPFKTNTFILHGPMELQQFANSLKEKQRTVVASVGLVTSFITPEGNAQLGRHFSGAPGALGLSGLHNLIFVLGVPAKTTPAQVGEMLDEAEESFGRQTLLSVDILIRLRKHKGSPEQLSILARQYAVWARDSELALLKPIDEQ